MSSVVIAGDVAGSITLQAPSSAGSTVLTLPAVSGTVMVNGPAFSAYQSTAQPITASTPTRLQFQTEEFDTNNNFDSTTNYRFTPTVAGYYQVNAAFYMIGGFTGGHAVVCWIYKNGVVYKAQTTRPTTSGTSANVSSIIYFNGATDYIEVYGYTDTASSGSTGIQQTFFNAAMIRSA